MTIGTDTLIDFFEGSVATLGTGSPTAAVNDGVMSAGLTDIVEWENTDDAPEAVMVLRIDTTASRTANRTIGIYAKLINMFNTAARDSKAPTTTFLHTFLGTFYPDNTDTEQHMHAIIPLPNTMSQQKYEFYLFNNCGEDWLTGWELWIDAKTKGPHA